jgi:hypothetical protein
MRGNTRVDDAEPHGVADRGHQPFGVRPRQAVHEKRVAKGRQRIAAVRPELYDENGIITSGCPVIDDERAQELTVLIDPVANPIIAGPPPVVIRPRRRRPKTDLAALARRQEDRVHCTSAPVVQPAEHHCARQRVAHRSAHLRSGRHANERTRSLQRSSFLAERLDFDSGSAVSNSAVKGAGQIERAR